MYKNISNKELAQMIRQAVSGDSIATFEIINQFQNLIIKNSYINGKFSSECKDYIEEKLVKRIKKFKKI